MCHASDIRQEQIIEQLFYPAASSSSRNYWLVDRKTLAAARSLDLKYATPQEIAWIGIWSANGGCTSCPSTMLLLC